VKTPIPGPRDLDLIVYDFDGVMTDNRVLVDQDGREAVFCNRSDGLAVGLIRDLGIDQLILSTEANPVVSARAAKLKLPVLQDCADKGQTLSRLLAERTVDPARVLFLGNDVNDLPALRLVGWPAAPADAAPEVLALARYVTRARGGEGVVRELARDLAGR
jgi:YrbI family 3-deoxy-D-manno-octulosonate 8-phosphate phosphatase